MLLDSNIIIHAAQPEHEKLGQFIETHTPAVLMISQIEVLGYHYNPNTSFIAYSPGS